MDNNKYQSLAPRTDLDDYTPIVDRVTQLNARLIHSHLGLSSEVGEVGDAIKKHVIYGQDLDIENLKEEAGDICWYLNILLEAVGTTWEEVMESNIAKLKKRYPEGFTEERAKTRLDKGDE